MKKKLRLKKFKESIEESFKYKHQQVEFKWVERWYRDNLYQANDNSKKPKRYVLDMYPYPSGEGLHVGHIEGYTASDIIARFKRMNGFEVLHPMGWDSFGLPTENYAIKTGENPKKVTKRNIDIFKSQCLRIGLGIDWSREIDTSDKDYYKWTQQIFLKLYKQNLAQKIETIANWCPKCQTVIANEQVLEGKCERCESIVERKKMKQWVFRITKYADRLIQGLDKLDWPESTKIAQKNWIGKSMGVKIDFKIEDKDILISVFTTRPETLYGVTFLVVAPEHSFIKKIVSHENKNIVQNYVDKITKKSDLERKKAEKFKTGVFTGAFAKNPLTGEKIPIWVSEYVLMDYGSGMVMGVPAHDERDFSFAKVHKLPIIPVIKPYNGKIFKEKPFTEKKGIMVVGKYQGIDIEEAKEKIIQELSRKAKRAVQYKLRDWIISRERFWGAPIPIIYCNKCGEQPVPEDQLPVVLPEDIEDYRPKGIPPLSQSQKFIETVCPKCGKKAERETKTLDTFVDSAWYFMRFCDSENNKEFASQKLLERWMPVNFYIGGTEHITGHLLYARFIIKVLHDLGCCSFDEPFLKLRHQGIILGGDNRKMSKRWGNVVNPDDIVKDFGADALRIYEMFMGPLELSKPWNTKGVRGIRKFIDRVWLLKNKVNTDNSTLPDRNEKNFINHLVHKVTNYIEIERYNVAISEFMKFLNKTESLKKISQKSWEKFLLCLAPFAPFITEELWEQLGNRYSIHLQSWPKVEGAIHEERSRLIPVQINGKLRGKIIVDLTSNLTTEDVLDLIKQDKNLSKKIVNFKIKKVIYVSGKIINIVIE